MRHAGLRRAERRGDVGERLPRLVPVGDGEYLLASLAGVQITDCYVDEGSEVFAAVEDNTVVIRRTSDEKLLAMGIIRPA